MGSGNFHGLVLRQDAIVVAEIQSSCCLLFVRICNPHILSIGIFNPAITLHHFQRIMSTLFAFRRVLRHSFCFCGTFVHRRQEMGLFLIAADNQLVITASFRRRC